jgi:two-component system, cell cycle response regulator
MLCLVIDDDGVSRRQLQKYVEALGHQCFVAPDGEEGWKLYCEKSPDIILSDWIMPGLSGQELCRRVRDRPSAAYTYIVLITALADKAHFIEGMQAGADDFLYKPLDLDELRVRIMAATRVTTLHRQLREKKTELESMNARFYEEGRVDSLTKVGNRRRMEEDLDQLRARVERYGHIYSVALCDIDQFKSYNDTAGHLAGDDVLRDVATILEAQCREGDLIYRFGGEEFLIILPEQSLKLASVVMGRMRAAVEEKQIPHPGLKPPGVVTMSVGVAALVTPQNTTVEDLLKQADSALYAAKEAGRNCVAIYLEKGPRVLKEGARI